MGWLDDIWGGGGDTAFGTDTFSGGGWDWGSLLGGDDSSWTSDLWSVGGGGGDGGSWWSSLLGGGGGSSGGGTGDIFKMILGGLGSSAEMNAQRGMSAEQIKLTGAESRKNASYAADLADFYKQKDNRNKRIALDTYGQFSTLRGWKPDYVEPPVPTLPARPTP